MKTITIETEKELKAFLLKNRAAINNINGVECNPLYPIIECSNRHAIYYDVIPQVGGKTKILSAPFFLTLNYN